MNAIERLIDQWRSAGVQLEPPAPEAELGALARALAAPLPDGLALFYSFANGMPDLEYDTHQVSFWSISKILTEHKSRSGTDPNGPFTDLAMGDFLINSWFLRLRVRDGDVSLFIEGSGEEVPSLSALASRYLEAPESLPIL